MFGLAWGCHLAWWFPSAGVFHALGGGKRAAGSEGITSASASASASHRIAHVKHIITILLYIYVYLYYLFLPANTTALSSWLPQCVHDAELWIPSLWIPWNLRFLACLVVGCSGFAKKKKD